jgi:hypothetical protein
MPPIMLVSHIVPITRRKPSLISAIPAQPRVNVPLVLCVNRSAGQALSTYHMTFRDAATLDFSSSTSQTIR